MKKTVFKVLSLAVVFAVFFAACAGETDNNNPDNDNDSSIVSIPDIDLPLPAPIGNNAVSGKEFFVGMDSVCIKITFSVTSAGNANGTYVRTESDFLTDTQTGVKFTFGTIEETGTYSWNETLKTVTLKPEKKGYGLRDRAAYRSYLSVQALNLSVQALNAYLSSDSLESGVVFSSATDYINWLVNDYFKNEKMDYSFSSDGKMLFLQDALPENIGTNELTGKYDAYVPKGGMILDGFCFGSFTFTSSGYTFTPDNTSISLFPPETGLYAYDSNRKMVWVKPIMVDGKNQSAYYSALTIPNGHHFSDNDTYRAAMTNFAFYKGDKAAVIDELNFKSFRYDNTNKDMSGRSR